MTTAVGTIRLAVFTSLYPNSMFPRHGVFVEERLRQLIASGRVEARVIAPVPWFFSRDARFGHYARQARVPVVEYRHGIRIDHPRYVVVPKVGMTLGPASIARAGVAALETLLADGFDFDLIDAHYVYPDGVAASRLGQRFGRPVVMTARGADLNSIAEMSIPGRQIRAAMRGVEGMITVSRSLADKARLLGLAPRRLQTLRNGVDLSRFTLADRDAGRKRLGLDGPVWLCVGHLIERKGMHVAIDALARVPDAELIIAGDGPEEAALKRQVASLGVAGRTRFVGAVEHDALVEYYNAADALILASRSEGMPNVLLEALACGLAVIANPVDGIPEIMTDRLAGRLTDDRTGEAVVRAWEDLQEQELTPAGRADRRAWAEQFSWQATTDGQLALYDDILSTRAGTATEHRP
ncbi:glycosyltransferase family 4 protein [Salinisphaera sp. T31B1]|uniref:glycosyltransferase family 4 protein n=1 Tax=Salinisphaera sp. T31B1 TaxID=727963 RepID=UPI00333F3831